MFYRANICCVKHSHNVTSESVQGIPAQKSCGTPTVLTYDNGQSIHLVCEKSWIQLQAGSYQNFKMVLPCLGLII